MECRCGQKSNFKLYIYPLLYHCVSTLSIALHVSISDLQYIYLRSYYMCAVYFNMYRSTYVSPGTCKSDIIKC